MGQKVNPKGLRTGVIYNWDSRWFFSKRKQFKDTLISDIKIRETIYEKFTFASVTSVIIERAINKITVIIYAVKPGMIIGRGGKGLEDVKKVIMQYLNESKTKKNKETKVDLRIEPVKKPYLSARYVAQTIAEKLVKNFPHRGVVHKDRKSVV